MLRDVALLTLPPMDGASALLTWTAEDAAALRREAARGLDQQDHAARLLQPHAEELVAGIDLASFVGPGAPFGPAWPSHPFTSPAMHVGYKLREADLTRELADLMGPAAGRRGPERARSFLNALSEVALVHALAEALDDAASPLVTAEHPVRAGRGARVATKAARGKGRGVGRAARASAQRIDLLFQWPCRTGKQAVVAVEAKLAATVSDGQLSPYRAEAARVARGGPVHLFLLTLHADRAERRHRAWVPVRWLAVMRRWECLLAEAKDADPEFARVRAHVWRFILSSKGPLS